MDSPLSQEVQETALRYAAQGRCEIEQRNFRRNTWVVRTFRRLSRLLGVFALAVFAAGFSIACVVIVLNVIFQYAPKS